MVDFLLSILFPPKCPYCLRVIKRGMPECNECRLQFPKNPVLNKLSSGEYCVTPFVYDSSVREAILRYKFRGAKFNAESFAAAIADSIEKVYEYESFDIIMCVPISKKRLRERGYNQSELIAKKLCKYFKKPFDSSLVKIKDNMEQHNLSAQFRITNVLGVYGVKDARGISHKRVLLIDDIVTTGNTMLECCKTLKNNGADKVLCAAIAFSSKK